MADLLHSNLSMSFIFSSLSLPLNYSPLRHFSFIRFSPLNCRFSHSWSLLAKSSSHFSQFHIISRTDNSDGSVSFKFGYLSEISSTVDGSDGGNEVDLVKDNDESLDNQGNVVADDESDSIDEKSVTNSVELKEIVKESADSESDSQSCEGFVGDKLNSTSISTAEVENLSDSIEDDVVNNGATSTAEVENSSDSIENDEVNNGSISTAQVENSVDSVEEDEVKSNSNLTAEVENLSDSVEDELKSNSNSTAEAENLSASVEDELISDSNLTATVEVESLGGTAEVELKTDLTLTAEVENSSDSVEEELDSDSISIAEVTNSSDIDTAKYENQIADNVVPTCDSSVGVMAEKSDELREDSEEMSDSGKREHEDELSNTGKTRVDVMIKNAGELSEVSVEMGDVDKLEDGGGESAMITETSHSVKERVVEDVNDTVMSQQSETEQTLEKEKEDMMGLMSKQLEAEPIIDQEDMDTVESMSKQLEAEPIIDQDEESSSVSLDGVVVLGSNKVALAGHPSIAKLDEQLTHDTSDAARPGVEASGITSTETTSDSVNMEDMSSVAASAPLSLEVNDVSPPIVSQSIDDQHCCDMSLEAGPVYEPSGLASASISLDSMETSNTANSVTPVVSSSTDYSEVQDITTYTSAQNDDDCNDTLVAVHPATSGITLAEISLESLNKEESLAPAISISSAVASLSHSLEALTGGKDASFVSNNWFGVADGVGQWSFGGVDVGLYAHEFMQNCEQLLKSESAGLTNVKKLLQQSAAMTQSTGSARVLIAHVANQVLHVANIGDSGFLIIRNGTIFRKSSPMVHEFSFPYAIGLGDVSVEDVEEYHIELEEGDVIITATDGLFDNLYEQEIASIVSKSVEAGMHLQDLAELLASKAQEVGRSESARSPFADAAQAAGHPEFSGGKFDYVTVIVSLVQR